ncbi:NAD(P)-dependent alcohol dehydrogenase [Actinosynnema sp. NPDC047251]|uniref:Alcohol dehydrogenase zinc-binding domain protein n=1 Tax=Saccharothrix espanaensis (strain ATCC 51144 / DSM 44229 / JCM 9112 / NBRC 15066 / NRRL 15764) TaxID=1179773 RepID=K0JZW3_SACES|nr:NAD(P)-dependent alcohol dehydrogenase [Saccharothrix espanaensis]CCH30199.1 Alcohol dehydrogenase zinc-binding domain protein [Saccharothrix espanaensis DSM 44229]
MTPVDHDQTAESEMRAALFDRYGPPSVLYEAKVPIPRHTSKEIRVRVHATTVNGGELAARAGELRLLMGRRFPRYIGMDFVGEVVDVGSSVTDARNGEFVCGVLPRSTELIGRRGSAAEYVTVKPNRVTRKPRNLTSVEAASILGGGTTSITALRDVAHLQPGERLLIRGASGGVGSMAVQIGKAFGAHVTGLAGKSNLDFVRDLGADEVFDYRTTQPGQLGRFDVVLDTVGTDHATYRRLLTRTGRMVAIAFDTSHLVRSVGYLLASTVHGSKRVRFFSGNPQRELFAELVQLAEDGEVRPVVDTVHQLSDIAAAHAALEAGGVRGKHIIEVTPHPE